MLSQKQWRLLTYDIRDHRRLRKVHRTAARHGLAVQKSVFLLHCSQRSLAEVLRELEALIEPGHDDVRAYPIPHPTQVWMSGDMSLGAHTPSLRPAEHSVVEGGVIARWRRRLGVGS